MSKAGFFIDEKSFNVLQATLIKMPKKYIDVTAIVQFNIGVDIISLAKTRIPLEMGDLRDSGFVEPPNYKGRSLVSVDLGFVAEYAVIQHETEEYQHPGTKSKNPAAGAQGQWKYLETSANELTDKLNSEIRKAIDQFQKDETYPTVKSSPHNKSRTG